MPDFTHGDKPMPSGWKPPGYDYRSQQQGNDLAAPDSKPTQSELESAQSTIEDKLREILWDFHYDIDEKNPNENLESLSDAVDKLQAIITTETTRKEHEARMNLLEYFDQIPKNEHMDWKGLIADCKRLLKEEQE